MVLPLILESCISPKVATPNDRDIDWWLAQRAHDQGVTGLVAGRAQGVRACFCFTQRDLLKCLSENGISDNALMRHRHQRCLGEHALQIGDRHTLTLHREALDHLGAYLMVSLGIE